MTLHKEAIFYPKAIYTAIKTHFKAQQEINRPLAEGGESTIFAICYSVISGSLPHPNAVVNAMHMEDIVERQNRYGDEQIIRKQTAVQPYWERTHFFDEYIDLFKKIALDLTNRYGKSDGLLRVKNIESALKSWHETTWVVERHMHTNSPLEDCSEKEHQLFFQTGLTSNNLSPIEKIKLYREALDNLWLQTLILTISDGDQEKTQKCLPSLLKLTLLYQLGDDFAYQFRNSALGKPAFFTKPPTVSPLQVLNKVPTLVNQGENLLEQLSIPDPLRLVLLLGWLSRTAVCLILSMSTPNNKYRNDDLFQRLNNFEKNRVRVQ